MKALVIARRELAGYFFSPISWVVMTLFLVATGYEFWILMALLNGREAPHGAVLQYFFGGTFLYWLFLMFIVAVIAMRLIAEERRSGTLEPLLTAPVSEFDVVLGKYLGALAFYLALWAPTSIYVLILRSHAAVQAGPIVSGYLGTLLVGAGALALGLCASTVTRNQIVAAALSFVGLTVLLLIGAVGDTQVRSGPWAPVLQYVNLFRHMEDFGRGIVDSRHITHHLSLVVLGLYASARLLSPSRRGFAEIFVLVAVLVGVNVLSARHYFRSDWTRGRTFTLSEKTLNLLHGLKQPIEIVVFMLPGGENDLYDDVHELLDRAGRESPRLQVDWIDIDRDRERALTVAKRYNVAADDVTSGVIIVQGSGPPKFIPKSELADYREGELTAWKGEQALMSALLQVTEEKAPEICFVQGHGEPAIDSWEQGEYGDFAEELRRDHYTPKAIELDAIPKSCELVVEAGPEQPLSKTHATAIGAFLDGGGRLLLLDGPHFDPQVTRFAPMGLEETLSHYGISLQNAVVVDQPRLQGSAVAFAVSETYADHPVTAHLMHHRTLWASVREIRAENDARELIHTSDSGWGETDLGIFHAAAELSFDPARDHKGPISIGAAVERGRTRIVALGSSEIAGNREILGYNRDLLLSSVAWLLDAPPRLALGPRTPEHVRLRLDDAELTRVFELSVILLPLLMLLIGAGVYWVRRT